MRNVSLPPLSEIKRELARRSFRDFIAYTDPEYVFNWHHEVMAEYLEEWAFGDIDFMIMEQPPQHGKSEQVSRKLPAYIFGRDPDARVIGTSYAATLAEKMNRDVQRVMDSREYAELFPESTLSPERIVTQTAKPLRNSETFEIPNHRGGYLCAGVGGPITGFGFTHGIIDDPIKNFKDALSETIRESHWEWYTSTFRSRRSRDVRGGKTRNPKILINMTRWHEDDLAGRVLEKAKETGEKWVLVRFPAIAEEGDDKFPRDPHDKRKVGEPLWPLKHPLNDLMVTKATVGSFQWAGLYQQRPAPDEGGIFKRKDWQYYEQLPEVFDDACISADMTFKEEGTSYVAVEGWVRRGPNFFLLPTTFHEKADFSGAKRGFVSMINAYPKIRAKLVEDKANGPAIISALKQNVPGLIPIEPDGTKYARAMAIQPLHESHNLWLPDPEHFRCAWLMDFIDECANFPNAKNNDWVDAMTQAVSWLYRRMPTFLNVPPGSITQESYWRR